MRAEDERLIVQALSARYPLFSITTIERWVHVESTKFDHATITKYVPVLVQRQVEATLHELARTEGTSSDELALVREDARVR
jgi:hypothetical protein